MCFREIISEEYEQPGLLRRRLMKFSVVTTLYNSEKFLPDFYARMSEVIKKITEDYEIIFVNDGSPDTSIQLAEKIAFHDHHVKVVDLSRNFGHHAAAYAAIEAASGHRVFLIDVDLEEQPEWLADFVNIMDSENADVVYGVQRRREGDFSRKTTGLFYKVFNRLSETPITPNICTVRLMNRKYVEALLQLRDHNLFMAGMFAWVGFHQVAVPVDKSMRRSLTNYTILRLFNLLVDAITSFSPKPLYVAFFMGFFLSTTAGLFGASLVIRKLLFPNTMLLGYTSLVISIFFMGGLTILFLGVIGIYISKIFVEAKDRPIYLVRRRIGFNQAESKGHHLNDHS